MRKLNKIEKLEYNEIARMMREQGISDFGCQKRYPHWPMSDIAEVRKQQCL